MKRLILSAITACSLPLMHQPIVNAQAVDAIPRDRFCNKEDSLQQHQHLSHSIDYSDKGCPQYSEKLLPTITRTIDGRVYKIPDFNRISWDSMPPASAPGYIEVPPSITKQLGFDPSRSWKAGQKPASYTMLADADEAFGLGKLSLQDIAKLQVTASPLNGDSSLDQNNSEFGIRNSELKRYKPLALATEKKEKIVPSHLVRGAKRLYFKPPALAVGSIPNSEFRIPNSDDPINALTLANFGVIKKQTISTLLKAIPQLGTLDVSEVTPIQDLLAMNGMQTSIGAIAELVQQNPQIGDLPFKQLDLTKYRLDSIPEGLLSSTPLDAFSRYEEAFVSEIPGLNRVPFAKLAPQLFGEMMNFQFFAQADLYWGNTGSLKPAEHGDSRVPDSQFVSGRVTCSGKNVPVAPKAFTPYGYIELTDTSRQGAYYGSRWASGLDQDVDGGCGLLSRVNGGKEPTGRLVYVTDVLKIVLDQVDQRHESATFRAYTHICARLPFGQKTCTPYCFSALPWLSVSGQNWVQIGRGSL